MASTQVTILFIEYNEFENDTFKITTTSPPGVNESVSFAIIGLVKHVVDQEVVFKISEQSDMIM